MKPIVIVGTGLAGYSLAREIRKLDKDIPLRLITADDGRAYSKPMLSNALGKGKSADQLATADANQMTEQLNAVIDTCTRVEFIDRTARYIQTDKGMVEYGRLVLALGADPIRLALEGNASEAVLSINDLSAYARFRNQLKPGSSILIMGAGLIGCEFANDLVVTGHPVTVIDPGEQPLGRLLPEQSATQLTRVLQTEGVNWRFGTTARRIETKDDGFTVTLSDDTELQTDMVLSAVGLRPRKQLAEQSGLKCNRGIEVDRLLNTIDDDIFALGDCAEICGMVLPFVMPIMHAARALASTLCGSPTAVTFPAMPVVVKTPSCPLVFSPPPADRPGSWSVQELAGGSVAHFNQVDGRLLGFALTGTGIAEKQALTKQLPAVLE